MEDSRKASTGHGIGLRCGIRVRTVTGFRRIVRLAGTGERLRGFCEKLQKASNRGGERFRFLVNDGKSAEPLDVVQRQGYQRTQFDFPTHCRQGQEGDSRADFDRPLDDLHVIERVNNVDMNLGLPQPLVGLGPHSQLGREPDE